MLIQKFEDNNLQAICDVLADTAEGLTGSEISKLLNQLNISDPFPAATKRVRLFHALSAKQHQDNCGNYIIVFIKNAMAPVRYVNSSELFDARRSRLNAVLAFSGYELYKDGEMKISKKVNTIDEAQERANRLKKQLIERKVHSDVLNFCRAELLQDNYFHAVLEAAKSVAEKIRIKTGLTEDGIEIVDKAFGIKEPLLAINSLRTETEQSEQKGFANLLKGLFGTFRNVTAHAPKIKWPIQEEDALDLLSLVSYIHRKIDTAVSTNPQVSK